MRRTLSIVAVLIAIPGLSLVFSAGIAAADHPSACHDDTTIERTYTHGDPRTGLLSRHGYYYLDVKFGTGPDGRPCGIGADGNVHIVSYVHALQLIPTVGDLAHGVVPDDTHHAVYWLEYHGYASTGAEYALPGGTSGNGDEGVSTTDHLDACDPNGAGDGSEVCQDGPGTSRLVLRYDGPDVFGLASGKDARFRIANESGLVITDFAQMDVVASSTSWPPIATGDPAPK